MTRILAYRFSALGDVAMTVPVLRELLEQNPELEIIFVSRSSFADLFEGIPNLFFKGIDIEDYRGLFGMRKLANQLTAEFSPDAIADLHDVIRTKILNRIFKKRGYRVSVIDKEKEDKEHLTDIWNLEKKPLKHNTERYADVFREVGFTVNLSHQFRGVSKHKEGIGFAPFAQHRGKMLPLNKCFEAAKILSEKHKLYFFGGGSSEVEILDDWVRQIPGSENMAGKFTLKEELQKIAELQTMISMDSANMHLASIARTRCVSVWGSTHPFAGFLGYGQRYEDVVQVKDLSCRPCSVFGDVPCYRGDWACLEELAVQQIISKI